jgi:POT family proton-dependent oligopeptide transporter
MMGSIGAAWLAPIRNAVPLEAFVLGVLVLPPLGMALVKPSVVGTTGAASGENVRAIGYSIYYTMVNIGSTCGPLLAGELFYSKWPQSVFFMAAASVFLMFFVVVFFFRNPTTAKVAASKSFAEVGRDFVLVFSNWRFVVFLLIFSGYWIVYWQQFLILPLYITQYVRGGANANAVQILSVDPLTVIFLTVAVNALLRKLPALRAVILGTLITSLAWLVIAAYGSVATAVLALIVLAFGEIIQSPRYYEYISGLAPQGQLGQYMGFAFVPIGIGSLFGGKFGGALLHHFGEVTHQPQEIWPIVTALGIVTTLLLWIYDRAIAPHKLDEAKPATV